MTTIDLRSRLAALADFYATLTPDSVSKVAQFYAADAQFKDPFNEVRGIAAIEHIFAHMFTQVDAPRFEVVSSVLDGQEAFITWEMHYRFRGEAASQVIRGATHLRYDAEGRITLHRDYWDAAEELYEKLPLLGALMRWLKRRARA